MTPQEALQEALSTVGGSPSALAAKLGDGVARQNVEYWLRKGRVPAEYCPAIERATDGTVTRRDLRPDDWHRIWPELVTAEHPAPEPTTTAGA